MAPNPPHPRLRRLRRRHLTLGPLDTRADVHPAVARAPRDAVAGPRLERVVTRVPPARTPPRECVE